MSGEETQTQRFIVDFGDVFLDRNAELGEQRHQEEAARKQRQVEFETEHEV